MTVGPSEAGLVSPHCINLILLRALGRRHGEKSSKLWSSWIVAHDYILAQPIDLSIGLNFLMLFSTASPRQVKPTNTPACFAEMQKCGASGPLSPSSRAIFSLVCNCGMYCEENHLVFLSREDMRCPEDSPSVYQRLLGNYFA